MNPYFYEYEVRQRLADMEREYERSRLMATYGIPSTMGLLRRFWQRIASISGLQSQAARAEAGSAEEPGAASDAA